MAEQGSLAAMEQDRIYPTMTGAGYRLAAPALRTKQRLQEGQSSLEFPTRNARETAGQDWAGLEAEERDWKAAEDDPGLWGSGFRLPVSGASRIPWRDCLVVARQAAVIGAMGCAGFALVLYASQPRPAGHERVAPADRVALAENLPQATEKLKSSAGEIRPQETGPPTAASAQMAAHSVDPAPLQASSTPSAATSPRDMAAQPASIPALATPAAASPAPSPAQTAAESSSTTDEEAAPAEAAAPMIGPTAPVRVRSAAPARAAVPAQRPVPVQTAAAERNGASRAHAATPRMAARASQPVQLAARARDRAAPEKFALPGWLTTSRPSRPKVLVMSEPPHSLTPPPGMQAAPAPSPSLVVPAMALPPLRQPVMPRYANASPYGSGYGNYYGYRSPYWQSPAPPASGIYYGAPGVPPPQPAY